MTEKTTQIDRYRDPTGGPLMNKAQHNFKPCLYPALCADCEGIPGSVVVHLFSGETFEYSGVLGIDLTAGEIILRPAVGDPVHFPRDRVVYACCGRGFPPVLT